MDVKKHIQDRAASILPALVDIRRHIHQNPELSFQEYETAALVEKELQSLGLKTQRLANTGVVAVIEGKNPSKKVVGLRADIDALPILEVNDGRPYRSKKEGVMHACGHDVHTTSLLGAARILTELKDNFEGSIKLVFQPGEERLPGGASLMIAEGVLKNPKVDVMIGQHVMPGIETGKTGFRPGLYMASTDEIYVKVTGKGGHGAMPHFNIDPVLISAHLIVALQQIVSRAANPAIPSVLSFGKVIAQGATNVIPNEVIIEGTFRTLDENWRAEAHQKMLTLARGLVEGMGGTVDFDIKRGYPFLKNNEDLTERLQSEAKSFLGEQNVEHLGIWMAAEDFSYFTQEVPSCFYRLGTRNEAKKTTFSVHHPNFDVDEDALEQGCGLLAYLAISELQR
ncbi:MAG: M20 family metallopeptidase [Bacteroidetes bacterium]|nr:M20 family metallopeptidase [Bacteroidota bacterium]MDA1224568.1 M20 family metallopeptidase [Bacteroidota bacterium]